MIPQLDTSALSIKLRFGQIETQHRADALAAFPTMSAETFTVLPISGAQFRAAGKRPKLTTQPFTATEADQANSNANPDYRPLALPAPWGERITLAGAELAPEFGGYLEGALAAAEAAVGA